MSRLLTRFRSRNLLALLITQVVVNLIILLDIPVARPLAGFLFFTFVPGYLFIKLLRLDDLDIVETVIFSVGSSVAFLMLIGLAINEFGSMFGASNSLSLWGLVIVFNGLILLGWLIVGMRRKEIGAFQSKTLVPSPSHLLLLVLPILSIAGAVAMNSFGNNLVLLLMIVAIASFFVIAVLKGGRLHRGFYPQLLLVISISMLLHSSLISRYLVNFGSDISLEYAIARATVADSQWSPLGNPAAGRFDSMLSITILPTVYSALLNTDLTLIFKILYPMIFALVPLGLYQLWKKYLGDRGALIAAFLFIAQETFYGEMLGLARQMIAELFLVLLLFVVLKLKTQAPKKALLFTVFVTALVVSHYSVSLIFAFFVIFTFAFVVVTRKPSKMISLNMLLILLVIMFSWYIYTSKASTFNDILDYGNFVYSQLGQFFNPQSRGETVLRGIGLEAAPSIWNIISRVFAYLTEGLISLGFLALIAKKVKGNFEREYLAMSFVAIAFLGALVVVPGLARTFNMTRFYHVLLFFLAPLAVLGAVFLDKFVTKKQSEIKTSILLLIILVPYFLFQTSFVFEVTGVQTWSLALSGYRMNGYQLYFKLGYISDWSYYGALWVKENANVTMVPVYADRSSSPLLVSYGSVNIGEVAWLSNVTRVVANGTVFVGPLNVIDGVVVSEYYACGYDQLKFLDNMDKIYSNGGSEVYKNPSGAP